jgi:hypothetical protein
MPCWADDGQGICRMTTRKCGDQYGIAWLDECTSDSTDDMLPLDSRLCAAYLACQQAACTDVTGCFKSKFTQFANVKCTLHIDPTSTPDQPIRPCPGTDWTAPLPQIVTGTACPSAVIEGVLQDPFKLGFTSPTDTDVHPTTTACPNVLRIAGIDAPYPAAVPDLKELDLVVGEHLTHVTIYVVRSCEVVATPSLVCVAA